MTWKLICNMIPNQKNILPKRRFEQFFLSSTTDPLLAWPCFSDPSSCLFHQPFPKFESLWHEQIHSGKTKSRLIDRQKIFYGHFACASLGSLSARSNLHKMLCCQFGSQETAKENLRKIIKIDHFRNKIVNSKFEITKDNLKSLLSHQGGWSNKVHSSNNFIRSKQNLIDMIKSKSL